MAEVRQREYAVFRTFGPFSREGAEYASQLHAELSYWPRRVERHYQFHTHTALCYVYEGNFKLTVGDVTYDVNGGDAYIIRKGMAWTCSFSGKEPVRVLSVNFDGRLCEDMLGCYIAKEDVFFPRSGCRSLCDRLLEVGENRDVSSREMTDEFLLFLLRVFQRITAARSHDREAPLAERIRTHVHRYAFESKLAVESVAKAFSMRVQDLQEMWKKNYGVTVHRYIQTIRLAKAAELLSMSEISIMQIADSVGYADRCYLDKLFLKEYGVTPSAYRKAKRKEWDSKE